MGLLGLISLALLVLIYVLRPNYQNRLVSTTFVWKLSMKYRRKRLPVSRLRNLLILLCQILLLVSLALMMAQPAVPVTTGTSDNEKIAIVDASASMMVASKNETRYQRALARLNELAEDTLALDDGILSIIVAGNEAYYAQTGLTNADADDLPVIMEELADACEYGSADIDGAAELAEQLLQRNSRAEVIYYTATTHSGPGTFTVENVASDDDWNAAVLGVEAVLSDTNTYTFNIDVGCFGYTKQMNIYCELLNPNGKAGSYTAVIPEYFSDNAGQDRKTIEVPYSRFSGISEAVYSFESLTVRLEEDDSFKQDNSFYVFGGTKPVLNVQYSTSESDVFYRSAVLAAREKMPWWDIRLELVNDPADAATEGFDLYIYEGTMPDRIPKDGVVLLSNPSTAPADAGFEISDSVTQVPVDTPIRVETAHPLTEGMEGFPMQAMMYRSVTSAPGYTELLSLDGRPVLLTKNDADAKIVLLTLSLNYSDFAFVPLSMMIYNMFGYYFPPTLEKNAYAVGETITINSRGDGLSIKTPDGNEAVDYDETPVTMTAVTPGDYEVTQSGMSGTITDRFYVYIPNDESAITRVADALPEIYADETNDDGYDDLILWFAIAAIVLFAAEWLLHSRENL